MRPSPWTASLKRRDALALATESLRDRHPPGTSAGQRPVARSVDVHAFVPAPSSTHRASTPERSPKLGGWYGGYV
jgi:hypothetical protein